MSAFTLRWVWPCLGFAIAAEFAAVSPAPNPTRDPFSSAVASSERFAWVGLHGAGSEGREPGRVQVFTRASEGERWSEPQTLAAEPTTPGDFFGFALALQDERAVVGAPRDDTSATDAGAVYVYRHQEGSWTLEQKLVASDAWRLDFFGHSVALDGDTIAVGACYRDGEETDAGAAYVFRFDGAAWVEEQKLTAKDGERSDLFGAAVGLSADRLVVGAPWHAGLAGAAYVFHRSGNGWTEAQKLSASDANSRDRFGSSVSILDDVAVIGALARDRRADPGAREDPEDIGAAYVFRLEQAGEFRQEAILEPAEDSAQGFGLSVRLSPQGLLVAGRETGGPARIDLFRERDGGWAREQQFAASDSAALAGFVEPLDRGVSPVGLWSGTPLAHELDAQSADRLRRLILPGPDESHWARIPWMIDFPEARRKAAAAGKPLVVWRMVGEPLGFC